MPVGDRRSLPARTVGVKEGGIIYGLPYIHVIYDIAYHKRKTMDPIATSPRALGQAIRSLRRQRGMTQAELAEACVLRQATVSAAENGAPGTRLATVFRLLAVLGREIVLRDREWVLVERDHLE